MAGSLGNSKVESSEAECPLHLSRIVPLSLVKIFQIPMIGDDLEWMISSLQPMPLLLQVNFGSQ